MGNLKAFTDTKTPFWAEFGARSEEEWIAYRSYYWELDKKAYAEYADAHPDEDPEDFEYEVNAMTIGEWREANK